MIITNLNGSRFLPGVGRDNNVEIFNAFNQAAAAKSLFHQLLGGFDLFRCDILEYCQNPFYVTANDSKGCGCVNALHAAGIGDGYAFYIFHDVAAAVYFTAIRHGFQNFSYFGSGIGDRNRFRTAQSHNEFIL